VRADDADYDRADPAEQQSAVFDRMRHRQDARAQRGL